MKAFTLLVHYKDTNGEIFSRQQFVLIKRRKMVNGKTRYSYVINPQTDFAFKGYIDKDEYIIVNDIIKEVLEKEHYFSKIADIMFVTEVKF